MPSPGLVARFTRARRSVERLRRISGIPFEEYIADEDLLLISERLLHILFESILDIAAFIVAREGVASGPTYRDVMRAASKLLGLEGEKRRLALSIAGMRNVLVHGYAEIKHDILYDVIVNYLGDLEEILVRLWDKALELDP